MAYYILNDDLIRDKHEHIRLNSREYKQFNQIKDMLQSSESNKKITTTQTWIYILNIAEDKPINEDLAIKDNNRDIRQSIRINKLEQNRLLKIKSQFKTDIPNAQIWRYCLTVAYIDLMGDVVL